MKIKCKEVQHYHKNDGTSPMMFSPGIHDVTAKVAEYMLDRGYAVEVKDDDLEKLNKKVVPDDNYREELNEKVVSDNNYREELNEKVVSDNNNSEKLKKKADSLIKFT